MFVYKYVIENDWKVLEFHYGKGVGTLTVLLLYFLLIAKLELALTVLKPEAGSDPPDQLFLLSPAVIGKEHLQVQACSFSVL